MSLDQLTTAPLPPFGNLEITDIESAIRQIIEENEQSLAQLLKTTEIPPDWDNLMQPLDNLEDRLSNCWSTVQHLFGVNNSPQLREVYDRCQPLVTAYYTRINQNRPLYERTQALMARADELSLSPERIKVLEDYLLEFRLNGVDLETQDQQRFAKLETRLSQLSTEFSNNVLDSTHAWVKHIADPTKLAGLPEQAMATAARVARQKGLEGYALTLDAPCYIAVMTYAEDEALRRELYFAYNGRASGDFVAGKSWDNAGICVEILQLRREKAHLAGFRNFAEMSLARKMADTPDEVMGFLQNLAERARPVAESEYRELEEFAVGEGKQSLAAWDIPYYSEKLRRQRFNISQEALRVYFPLDRVKKGLFTVAEQLYGINVKRNDSYSTWHPEVESFDIFRQDKLIARFFFDLFTRDSKRGGAWMGECRSRRLLDNGNIQLPAAYLVCNFSAGNDGAPPLLTHNEVTTLFHEFGHGLHHLLTDESALRVSGINGVAWDAVELPSQLMENWCWDKDCIPLISGHYQTSEPLPDALLAKMLEARNFQAGLKVMRQLELGLFDFELHNSGNEIHAGTLRDVMEKVRTVTSVYPVPPENRFELSFSHIFSGGYAAGYYSYFWAEVLSADVFSRFASAGILDRQTGLEFLRKILSRGGAVKAIVLFRDFMGREPDVNALLLQKGIITG